MKYPDTTEGTMENATNERKSGRARRNRRRAKDLNATAIRDVKRDFDITRSSLEAAQNHFLPRSEAVDCALLVLDGAVQDIRIELSELRRAMGMATSASGSMPFLVRRSA